jgi:hypothetical protein
MTLRVLTQRVTRFRALENGLAAILASLLILTQSLPALAQMYSDELLDAKLARIRDNLNYTMKIDIPEHADPTYRNSAAQVVPKFRRRGLELLDFLHVDHTVPVGIDSLQFLDDLSTVRAWLDSRHCDGSLLQNYIFHHATPNGQPLDPVSAFGLDRESILTDSFVRDVSDKYYHTAMWFLLAHEIGHVARGQGGPSTLDEENAADDFALDVMRRKRLPPVGLVLYMTVIALYDNKVAQRTHASGGERLQRMADALHRSPGDFVAVTNKPREEHDTAIILNISDELSRLADALKTIQKKEQALAQGGARVEDVYRQMVFKQVDYKTACVARR